MGRIFNIQFQHEGHSYTALVTVGGKKNGDDVKVVASGGNIQITLRNGRLVLPITEVLHRVTASHLKGHENNTMQITDSISLQLLNTNW